VTILKNPCIFQSSGRSPGTIRPLAKPFSHFILYRAGRLEQLDHFFKKKTKKKSKKEKKIKTNQSKKKEKKKKKRRKRGRVFTIILFYKTYYTKSKENKFSNAFAL
jgi:hypothetical protein